MAANGLSAKRDADLISEAKAGDQEAFMKLWDRALLNDSQVRPS
jgi:hypothetical protein